MLQNVSGRDSLWASNGETLYAHKGAFQRDKKKHSGVSFVFYGGPGFVAINSCSAEIVKKR